MYVYVVIVASYSLGLFSYWLIGSKGQGSAWYFYVMGLLLSHIFSDGLGAVARYMRLTEDEYYFTLVHSPLWSGRLFIGAITITAIAIHATLRMKKG
jgi:hypothetical protein